MPWIAGNRRAKHSSTRAIVITALVFCAGAILCFCLEPHTHLSNTGFQSHSQSPLHRALHFDVEPPSFITESSRVLHGAVSKNSEASQNNSAKFSETRAPGTGDASATNREVEENVAAAPSATNEGVNENVDWKDDPMLERAGAVEILTFSSHRTRQPFSVCRIYGVGIKAPGFLLLPASLRESESLLTETCGLHPRTFGFFNESDPASNNGTVASNAASPCAGDHNSVFSARNLDFLVRAGEVNVSSDTLVSETLCSENFDALSPWRPMQRHFPHFLEDAAPVLDTLDELYHAEADVLVRCMLPDGSPCKWLPKVQKFETSQLRPAVVLEEHRRVQRAAPFDKSWIKQFLAFVAPRQHGGPAAVLLSRSIEESTNEWEVPTFVKLRSVLTRNVPKRRRSTSKDELFSNMGLLKSKRCVLENPSGGSDTSLRVLVLNRKASNGRDIPDTARIEDRLKSVQLPAQLRIEFSEHLFEGLTLREQAGLINSADVVIGAHGAGLANLLFMRTGAKMFEVFPFAYRPKIFSKQAQYWGVGWTGFMADPDEQPFVDKMLQASHAKELGKPHAKAVSRFQSIAKSSWRQANQTARSWPSLEFFNAPFIRVALRAQRLGLPESELQRLVAEIERHAKSLVRAECQMDE